MDVVRVITTLSTNEYINCNTTAGTKEADMNEIGGTVATQWLYTACLYKAIFLLKVIRIHV